ncbi:MAG: hydrogenase maturation protease [Armatimonadetes bacterium]|nr:hydrogenase maturation protease [Armatimonadota bacterium]
MGERRGGTLIVGLGSPILRDDAIGLHVAHALADHLPPDGFAVVEAGASGLRLLLLLEGWDRAVIIDAMREPTDPQLGLCPGRVNRLALDQLESTLTLNTSHEASLADTLALGRLMGMPLPADITVFGIEVEDPFSFGEEMSPDLADRLGAIVREIAGHCLRPLEVAGGLAP